MKESENKENIDRDNSSFVSVNLDDTAQEPEKKENALVTWLKNLVEKVGEFIDKVKDFVSGSKEPKLSSLENNENSHSSSEKQLIVREGMSPEMRETMNDFFKDIVPILKETNISEMSNSKNVSPPSTSRGSTETIDMDSPGFTGNANEHGR